MKKLSPLLPDIFFILVHNPQTDNLKKSQLLALLILSKWIESRLVDELVPSHSFTVSSCKEWRGGGVNNGIFFLIVHFLGQRVDNRDSRI